VVRPCGKASHSASRAAEPSLELQTVLSEADTHFDWQSIPIAGQTFTVSAAVVFSPKGRLDREHLQTKDKGLSRRSRGLWRREGIAQHQ
jgi:hypothetical protein